MPLVTIKTNGPRSNLDHISLTHELWLQSRASHCHDLFTCKRSRLKVSRFKQTEAIALPDWLMRLVISCCNLSIYNFLLTTELILLLPVVTSSDLARVDNYNVLLICHM